MTVTASLLRVYRVDQQITGLRTRLNAAERFLKEQERVLGELSTRADAIDAQLRQLKASAADAEGESNRLGEKIDGLRERMSSTNTSKEYQAILTETNTLKEQKSELESRALEHMEKIEALTTQRGEVQDQIAERQTLRERAAKERKEREEEIADKLSALEAERSGIVDDVPARALQTYKELVDRLGEEAMAPLEILDRRRHEYTCGSCMVIVPMEAMSALLSHGELTKCVSCEAILYLEENTRERMTAKSK